MQGTNTRADEFAVLPIASTIQPLAVRLLESFGERLRATINSGDKFKLFDCLRRRVLPSCASILPRRTSLIVCDETTHTVRTFAGSKPAYSSSNVFAACKLCVEKAKQHALFNRIWMPLCHYYPKCIFHDLRGSKRRQSRAAVECLA